MICPICENKIFKKIPLVHEVARWDKREYPLFKCKNCGLIRPFPLPYKNSSKLSIYDNDENIRFYNPNTKKINFESKEYKEYFKHFIQYENFVAKYKIEGKHLDAGCGAGHIVILLSLKGMKSEGLEISRKLVNAIKEKFKVYYSELESLKTKYNLITLSHVLEHIENPDKFVKELNKHLIENGYLIISVPYIKGIIPELLRTKWYGLGHGQHLNLFSKKSLKILFKNNGFVILEFKIRVLDYTYLKFPRILNLFILLISKLIEYLNFGDNLYLVAKKIKNIK